VLGSATYKAYKGSGHDVTGLAHSRATDHLKKLDLTNFPETDAFFENLRPDCELCVPRFYGLLPPNKGP
jgi:S-adenosylmethionine synthetase